jgi:hypothetical protein
MQALQDDVSKRIATLPPTYLPRNPELGISLRKPKPPQGCRWSSMVMSMDKNNTGMPLSAATSQFKIFTWNSSTNPRREAK